MATKRRKYTKRWLKGPDEFISTVDVALDWSSHHWPLLIGVALALIAVGLLGAGLIHHKRGIERELDTKLSRANSLYRQADEAQKGNYAQATRQYRALIQEFPDHPKVKWAYLHLGNIYFKTRAFPQASQIYTQALERSREGELAWEVALLGLGSSQEAMGRLKEAIPTYQRILSLKEASLTAQAHLALGRCYEQLKNPKQAFSHYSRYLERTRGDELIREKVEALKARR